MAKSTTPVTTEEAKAAPEGAGLDAAPAAEEPETLPGGGEVEPPVEPSSAYEQAAAFQPDPWDQMPEDPEVMQIYLAINGHLPSFLRHHH